MASWTTTTARVVATTAPTVDASNFENNAFSNFAPLLTLFGDETTKQFLSTSISFSDNILLGIAPIGIMTVIVSAIRLGGDKFLKSLIGRSRDSPDDEEKEILSSTSPNVREVWDGNRVIRQTGESKTKEYVYRSTLRYTFWKPKDTAVSTLEKSPLAYFLTKYMGRERVYIGGKQVLFANRAPNLILNSKKAIPETWKVRTVLGLGILIQAGVLTFNAIVVYNWRWLRAGRTVASYGYPVWAAGTVGITIGMSLCAQVAGFCTAIYTLHPPEDAESAALRIFRIQEPIPASSLPGYAIFNDEGNQLVNISVREWPPLAGEHQRNKRIDFDRPWLPDLRLLFTYLGTILTLAGFICQNIGTRELHWSAGVLQLGATLSLVALRAWLRTHVGDKLKPIPI